METITKIVEPLDLTVDEGSREVIAIISSSALDRDGEIVSPKGLIKKNYQSNPVVLLNHDYTGKLPIGVTRWIKIVGDKIYAKYYVTDKTQDGLDVFALIQDGVLKGHSIGFQPTESGPPTEKEIKANPHYAEARTIHRKWQILEFSVVPIGSNPEALAVAVAKGCSAKTADFIVKDWQERAKAGQKDCWGWKEEELIVPSKAVEKAAPELLVAQPIAEPKYCRSWRDIQKQLTRVAAGISNEDEIISRLKGKA